MNVRVRAKVFSLFAAAIAITAAPTLAQTPEGVSPGAVDRIDAVESRCPTFIWGGVSRAQAYELVVYQLPDEPHASDTVGLDLSASNQVLYSKVPGGATAWQPRLADGLDPGGSYVWFFRAVLREEAGEIVEAGDWSVGRFFSIPAIPSAEQVRQALEVLQSWEAANGDGSLSLSATADPVPAPIADLGAGAGGGAGASHPKSVPTAAAAIKGSIPDAAGETYGVVGLSNSPDGAGVAAANLNGGPDLVLDGSEDFLPDAELSESGIDRPWGTPQTFDIVNSLGAGMTLQVDGVDVTTTESDLDAAKLASGTVPSGRLAGTYSQALSLTNPANNFTGGGAGLTGIDADTLDGVDGADYATDAEAAGLVAIHAASADHDGRYYTETELNTSGAGGAVNWDNLTDVPAGFADGVDDDTTYSPGPGLIFDGGQILIDPAAFSTQLSTVDSAGFVGGQNSIAIGPDGLGLIGYYDVTNDNLKVAHCNDIACSSATTATLDSGGNVGRYPSIAIGADGLGLISYFDDTNDDLKVAHCNDIACSSATTATLDTTGDVGRLNSIAIGSDGLGLISYFDSTNGDLKVAHCNDIACSSASTYTLDSTGDVGSYTSIAIGADGLGLISYYDDTNDDLKVAHCNDIACSSATTATLDWSGDDCGSSTSIAIGADDLGLISYYNRTDQDLKAAHCNDIACSSATTVTLDSTDEVGSVTSIAIGSDGLGLISYRDSTNSAVKIARCNTTACQGANVAILVSLPSGGGETSITISSDGRGLISYGALYGSMCLNVAHLGIGVP